MDSSNNKLYQGEPLINQDHNKIEKRFIELSTNTSINYLDNHENTINTMIISIKNIFITCTMMLSTSFSIVLNNFTNTDLGQSIIKKVVNKILICENYYYRIREQFDINFKYPPINTEDFNPTINTFFSIYNTQIKEYVEKLDNIKK